jgi:hypothetical protein
MVCGNEYRWYVVGEGDGTVPFPLRPSTSSFKKEYILVLKIMLILLGF